MTLPIRYMPERSLRFIIYMLRCLRMTWRALWKGTDVQFVLLELFPQYIKSSWEVSGFIPRHGYKGEDFPKLFQTRERDENVLYTREATQRAIRNFRSKHNA
jgi:hypothetical protein